MSLMMYGETNQGLVRKSNQDALFFSKEYGIVIVSDGMGGHKGGEIASQLVVEGLRDAFLATSQILLENMESFLDDVLRNINAEILRQSNANEKLRGMGATVNYLQFAGGMLAIGHAGDSRTYLLRRAKNRSGKTTCHMWQLTIDHNVGTFVERGLLKLGPLKGNLTERQKSRLMRGMGVSVDLKSDLYTRQLCEGDVLLTCSDGLHGYVPEEAIMEAMCSGPIAQAPSRLINLAKSAGAPDNVTTVVSVWSEDNEPLTGEHPSHSGSGSYLLRMPDGVVLGPFDASEVVRKFSQGAIPLDAEVSAHGKSWMFFRKHNKLFEIYPEFNIPAVREYVSHMAPPSTAVPSVLKTSRQKAFAKVPLRKKIFVGIAVFAFVIVVTLFLLTWMELSVLRDTTLL
jgi:serine/threonine protein phosphatase PrpC